VNYLRDIVPLSPISKTSTYNGGANPNFIALLQCSKPSTFTFLKMSHLPLLVEVHFFLEMPNIVLIIGEMVDVVVMLPAMARAFFFSNLYYTQVVMNYDHVCD